MNIVVVANDDLKAELLQQGVKEPVNIEWIDDFRATSSTNADVCIDLLFMANPEERLEILKQLPVKLVIVNDVTGTTENLPASFVRINGWPTFLKRRVIEAATGNEKNKIRTAEIFNCFNKKTEWTTDVPGFITARIVSMIINEAYFALDENISTKEEIDIAMKLGTNYPYGPFEWCNLIGIKNVYSLLKELSKSDTRYQPSDLLKHQVSY
jgi:3-hydroxybutyryl-CoA dehydrogenase